MSKKITKKNRKKKTRTKQVFKELCHDPIDVFTQYELPDKIKDIIVLNDKSPYHCAELDSFYGYWKNVANDGKKVTNPFTNLKISDKILNKIWKKIKKKYPNDEKPKLENVRIVHTIDDDGMQEILRFQERQQPRRNRNPLPGFMEQPRRNRNPRSFISDELLDLLDSSDEEESANGGAKRKKNDKPLRNKDKQKKKIRKHKGINQRNGRLKKGYKYGKKLKSGLKKIIKKVY